MDSIEAAKARAIPTMLMSSLVETFRRKMLGIVIYLGNKTINTKRLKDSPILSDEFEKAGEGVSPLIRFLRDQTSTYRLCYLET